MARVKRTDEGVRKRDLSQVGFKVREEKGKNEYLIIAVNRFLISLF
jgi:hypothetical protein